MWEEKKGTRTFSLTLRLVGSPYILPPGASPERTQILRAAFRKIYDDPEFHKEYKKLVGDESSPLAAEEVQRAIETLPRDRLSSRRSS